MKPPPQTDDERRRITELNVKTITGNLTMLTERATRLEEKMAICLRFMRLWEARQRRGAA